MFFGFNITGGLKYFISSKKISSRELSGFSLLLFLISAGIGGILLLIPLPFDSVFFIDGHDSMFYRLFLYGSFLFALLNSILAGFLHGNKRFSAVNLITLINSILNFSIFCSMYFLHKAEIINAGLQEILFYSILVLAINSSLYLYFFRKYAWEGIKLFPFQIQSFKKLFSFLLPSFLSILINFFNYRLLIWVINFYESTEQLGYFSLALNFSQMLLISTAAINIVMFPHFSGMKDKEKARTDLILIFKINAFLIAGVSIVIRFFSTWLIPAFYGKEFLYSVEPFNILLIGTFFLSMSQVFGHFFGAMNKNWLNSLLYTIVLIVLGTLSIILTPKYGIAGASWANSIAYFLSFLLFAIMSFRKFKIPFQKLFYFSKSDLQQIKSLAGKYLGKPKQE